MVQPRRFLKTYTKRDIARRVARAGSVPVASALPWVDAVLGEIRGLMMNGERELRIEIRDFGVFEVKVTKSKPKARNPHTGAIVVVPARRKTHFKPGKLLRAYLSSPLDQTPRSASDATSTTDPSQ